MANLLDQLNTEKQRAADAHAADIKTYATILSRFNKPRRGDGAILAMLMTKLKIDDATLAQHVEIRRKVAERRHIVLAGEKAKADRAGVQRLIEKLTADRDAEARLWNEKIANVAGGLATIEQAISQAIHATDFIERTEGENPTAFGIVPPPPAQRRELTTEEILRAQQDQIDRARAEAVTSGFRELSEQDKAAAWQSLSDDQYLLAKKAVERNWLNNIGQPPAREIKPPKKTDEERIIQALKDGPPGMVSATFIPASRRVDPRDRLHI